MKKWVNAEFDVRYSECDPMGVVHHAHYFVWFEIGRMAFAQKAGIDLAKLTGEQIQMPVIEAGCHYKKSARFGDRVMVRTSLVPPKAAKLEFQYQLLKVPGNVLLAEGRTAHAIVRGSQGLLLQLPVPIKTRINEFLSL